MENSGEEKLQMVEINGQKVPVIKPVKTEEIRHPDGRVDCIITVPRLNLKNKKK